MILVHRWTQMEFFHSDLHILHTSPKCFHQLAFHWLLLSGMTLILEDLGTFSTEQHLMPLSSKELTISCRSCFHPLVTSLQPHCLLSHGTEQHHLEEDARYLLHTWQFVVTSAAWMGVCTHACYLKFLLWYCIERDWHHWYYASSYNILCSLPMCHNSWILPYFHRQTHSRL